MADSASSVQKYGVPFYGAAWVPYNEIRSKLVSNEEGDQDQPKDDKSSSETPATSSPNYVVLAGGGGEGRSGIPNAIIVSHVDFEAKTLSKQPVAKLTIGSDLPYRITVHPGGDGLICALPNSCRLFEWEELESSEVHKLNVKLSEKALTPLEDVGQQMALVFNHEGSVLAAGGEDGNLRVFKWPSMEIILNEAQAHTSVKDLTFSSDGKYLVSLGRALCRVWDVTSLNVAASLAKENDEAFSFCRFSPISDKDQTLYVAAMTGCGGSIIAWNTTSWERIRSKQVARDPISAFNVSADGNLLAVGTTQGDILIVSSTSMRVQTVVKKAHVGFVTALTFSHDSRALVSASMDSSARLTLVEHKKDGGMNLWIIISIILLAVAVYFMKKKGIVPWS